jgi:hypothetical protein
MSTRDVRNALLAVPVPDELEAQRRGWAIVRAAYATREPVPRRNRRLRLLVAVAVLGVLVAAALSPPGRSVGGWIHDRIAGEEKAEPALVRLPAAGRLLVVSEQGPWIVRPDGSTRFLGNYEDASFSPNGLFVIATEGRRVRALEPDGLPRWSISRPSPVADARWAPHPGYRVAYREGDTVRVAVGNGTNDRLLARGVAPVAPAWLPAAGRTVLAYADAADRIHVVEVDTNEQLWSAQLGSSPEKLVWSPDARLLLVLTTGQRHPVYRAGGRLARTLQTPPCHHVLDAAFAPGTHVLAYSAFDAETGKSAVVLGDDQLQSGDGHLEDLVFSPDGRRLLVGWPEANQLLFLPIGDARGIAAVNDVRREFDPGSVGAVEFPRFVAWCCSPR